MENKIEKLVQKANNAICWDNWSDDETGKPYKLGEVYFSKLEWIRENLDDEELLGIIDDLQETICPILNELDKD